MNRTTSAVVSVALAIAAWNVAGPARAASSKYKEGTVKEGGTLTGRVVWEGDIPVAKNVKLTTDEDVCKAHTDESLIIDKKTRGLKNMIVSIEGIKKGKKFASKKVTIDQKGCIFSPRIAVVPARGKLVFTNSDPVAHNVHTISRRNRPFNKVMPKNGKPMVNTRLRRKELIKLKCDIHSWMKGYILVTYHPYIAVTDENGRFSIADIPPGKYQVRIWHESLKQITIDKNEGLLFTAPAVDFQDDLERGVLSQELRDEFKKHKIDLPDLVAITSEEAGRKWRISAEGLIYIIHKKDETVSIYNEGKETSSASKGAKEAGAKGYPITIENGKTATLNFTATKRDEAAKGAKK